MAFIAKHRSKFLTGISHVSIWVNNSRVGRKLTPKQTKKISQIRTVAAGITTVARES